MRFLLGIAEAGFYPGVILYLSYWFPTHRRGKMYALFATAVPLSGLIGAPLSGWIMTALNGLHGYAGWQWMFFLEGLPSILVGGLVIYCLSDRIADVGSFGLPDIFEEGRTTVDAAVSKTIGKLRLRLSADNLTDTEVRFLQGAGNVHRVFKMGRTYMFQVGFSAF